LPDGTRPAPPHDANGHTWHHGDGFLFVYTKFGGQAYVEMNNITGFKSAMPAFADQLDDQDIWNVLGFIKSTWPDRVQAVQRERTANQ
jgi:mono/diheme cytochrome c family protein